MPTTGPSIPKRRDLIREVNVFARSSTARGLTLLVVDFALYAGAIGGVLFLPPFWAKVGCSLFAGMGVISALKPPHRRL